ncbi:MAG TPA: hypothetical protein VHC18_19635, partial [Amycolatopsis sp.]|nr:hypothetical protein [Amycolatopsis sp.]
MKGSPCRRSPANALPAGRLSLAAAAGHGSHGSACGAAWIDRTTPSDAVSDVVLVDDRLEAVRTHIRVAVEHIGLRRPRDIDAPAAAAGHSSAP